MDERNLAFVSVLEWRPNRSCIASTVESNARAWDQPDAASIYPTYRKPFDVIFQRVKNEEWCARKGQRRYHHLSQILSTPDCPQPWVR